MIKPTLLSLFAAAAVIFAAAAAADVKPGAPPAGAHPSPSADPLGRALVARFVDAFNRHDLNATGALVAENFREVFPDGQTIIGRAAFRDRIAFEIVAEPNVTIVLQHLVGDDRSAAAELTFVPSPKVHPVAPQYVYIFAVDGGLITSIAVYSRAAEAQKASAQPLPSTTPK